MSEGPSEGFEHDETEQLGVPPLSHPQRLDHWLTQQYPEMSRSYLQKLIGEGQIQVNGAPASKNGLKLVGHETLQITFPSPEPLDLQPENIPLSIVFEDEALLVINKPAGLVVHPGAGHRQGTLVNALLYHCQDLSGIGGVERPGIVHRLDKDTTGLLVVAKQDHAHQSLTAQLKERTMQRHYLALIPYRLPETSGAIESPIGRHPTDRKKMAVTVDGRWARTHWQTEQHFKGYTLLRLKLDTGRTHQIRVHLSHLKRPIVGDSLYGDTLKHPFAANRPMLHACSLSFQHPTSGAMMQFQIPLPDDMAALLSRLTEVL